MKQMIGELSYDRFLSIAIFGNELRMSAEPQGPLISSYMTRTRSKFESFELSSDMKTVVCLEFVFIVV